MIDLLKLIVNYGQLCGFTPTKIKNNATTSKVILVYSLALLIGFATFIIFYFIENTAEKLIINSIIMYIQSVPNIFGFITNIVYGWIHKDNLQRLANNLIYLKKQFKDYLLPKKLVILILICALIGSLLAAIIEYVCEFVMADKPVNVWRFLVAYFCLLCSSINIAQLLCFFVIIKRYYSAAGKQFEELVIQQSVSNGNITNEDFVILKHFRKNLYKMDQICELLNEYYSVQLLITFATSFLIITTQIFHCCFLKQFDEHVFSVIFKILVYFAHVVLLSMGCHKIISERQEIVDKLLNVTARRDDLLGKETFLLAYQMADFPVTFRAGYLFNINNSLILGVISTITTYVIVLVQFNAGTGGKFYDNEISYGDINPNKKN